MAAFGRYGISRGLDMLINPAPLAETVRMLREGQRSLSSYLEQQLQRLERIDPQLQAMLTDPQCRERLRLEAGALQSRYPDPSSRPLLFGALVGIKDIFHVNGYTTRAGSKVPPETFAGNEALCVTRLRKAGALILGKTVTTEFAYYEPGPTGNPHNLSHTPGGSSSGSAAAVAAGLCPLALGTQTIGSVIRPAAFCGIMGFKPSLDRIPTTGLVYFSRSVDHVGLFTQDIGGMALAASVLCNAWSGLPAVQRRPVVGVPDGPYLAQAEADALALFENQLAWLEKQGVVIKRIQVFDDIDRINRIHRRLAFGEMAREHADIYPRHKALYRPRTVEIIEAGLKVPDEELAELRLSCTRLQDALKTLMVENEIDLWVCPSATGPAPQGLHSTGDPIMNLPWTHAGMPVITLPFGRSATGLPLGFQFIASFGDDELLLAHVQRLADLFEVNFF